MPNTTTSNTVLAFDFGIRQIGVAIGQTLTGSANPLTVFKAKDGIPDWQGFSGVQVTDEEGYYRFSGLEPGNYIVFVWQVDNWEEGQPLHGFQSTNGFVADADNDIDFDNNEEILEEDI